MAPRFFVYPQKLSAPLIAARWKDAKPVCRSRAWEIWWTKRTEGLAARSSNSDCGLVGYPRIFGSLRFLFSTGRDTAFALRFAVLSEPLNSKGQTESFRKVDPCLLINTQTTFAWIEFNMPWHKFSRCRFVACMLSAAIGDNKKNLSFLSLNSQNEHGPELGSRPGRSDMWSPTAKKRSGAWCCRCDGRTVCTDGLRGHCRPRGRNTAVGHG